MYVSDDVIRAMTQMCNKLWEAIEAQVEVPGKLLQKAVVIKVPVENKPGYVYAMSMAINEYVTLDA